MIRLAILTGIIDYCMNRVDSVISARFAIWNAFEIELQFRDMVVGGHYLIALHDRYKRGYKHNSDRHLCNCDYQYIVVTDRYQYKGNTIIDGYAYGYMNGILDTTHSAVRSSFHEYMISSIAPVKIDRRLFVPWLIVK